MYDDIRYWLALMGIRGVGSAIMRRLTDRFGTPRDVFAAPLKELLTIKGIRVDTAHDITSFNEWDGIDRGVERAHQLGISVICWEDSRYPENILNIHDPPPVLYMKGRLEDTDSLAIAVVGSRNPSSYGLEATKYFCYRLARAGVTVVSGMARGIDTAAHADTISGGGRTVAVMGCGLDVVYPPENKRLFQRIEESGAALSEFPLGTQPDPGNFPRRNRIISGLSLGVLVVEASLKSGSLITASCALEQGREVYAVPGSINSIRSRGTNYLIREGARLVESPGEILEDILQQQRPTVPSKAAAVQGSRIPMSEKEEKLFSLLGAAPLHMDQIVQASLMDASEVSSILLQLELAGAVRQYPGKMFIKAFT